MKTRKRWLDELSSQYARLLDTDGIDSPLAKACMKWSEDDREVHAELAARMLLKFVFGSASQPNWGLVEDMPNGKRNPRRK